MKFDKTVIEIATSADTDIEDITPEVERFVASSDIESGWVLISIAGSTASVTTIEYESGAVADLRRACERLAPKDATYEHNLRWRDGNGYSHVRAALLGPSLTLPVAEGRPLCGVWQQIVLCDFDNRPRSRQIHLQIFGFSEPPTTPSNPLPSLPVDD